MEDKNRKVGPRTKNRILITSWPEKLPKSLDRAYKIGPNNISFVSRDLIIFLFALKVQTGKTMSKDLKQNTDHFLAK